MIIKDRFFSNIIVKTCYILSSRKVAIKYIGLLLIYAIIDPHNYILMALDGKILRGLFEQEGLKLATIKNSQKTEQVRV